MSKLIFSLFFLSLNCFALSKVSNDTNEDKDSANIIKHDLEYNHFYAQLFGCSARYGYRLTTESGTYEHSFVKQIEEGLSCEQYNKLAKDLGKKTEEKKNELIALIESQVVDRCNKLANIGNFFIKAKKDVEIENKDLLKQELNMIDQIKVYNIQDVHNVKALKGSLCVANSAFRDLTTYYILERKFKEAGSKEEPRSVVETGEVIESCYDVQASGSNDIKGFQVKVDGLLNNEMKITFDMYEIPDRIVVKQGRRTVFDSGCYQGRGKKEFTYAGSNSGYLTVDIEGDCTNPDGNMKFSNWFFRLQCNKKVDPAKLDPQICYDQIGKYLQLLKEIYDLEHKIMDTYWSQSLCYYSAHDRLVEDFMSEENKYLPLDLFSREDMKMMFMADKEEAQRRKTIQFKNNTKLPKPVQPEALLPNYKEFKDNRFKYCGMRPPKDENLFKTISFAYCFYGYLRLFDEENPIFD